MRYRRVALALSMLVPWLAASGDEDVPKQLDVLPRAISLTHARDRQSVVVVATYANGVTRDVTAEARLALANPLAELAEGSVLVPRRAGKTTLVATFGGSEAKSDVVVGGLEQPAPVSFANEVVPALTRAGCNQGSCHGAAQGKNGFRLSLFGYDKDADWVSVTHELRGRRINPADPVESLLLRKPTMQAVHKGGKRLEPGGATHELLRAWIAGGAASDTRSAPALTAVEVLPRRIVLEGAGQTQRLVVRARYADGSDRDVTAVALLSSTNESSAGVSSSGVVTSAESGEAFVLARYGTLAVVAQVLVLEKGKQLQWPDDAVPANYIDEAIYAKLKRLRIAPAPLCDDATFLRRVYLDVLNRLPSVEETRAFLADAGEGARARLVEDLLRRPELPDVLAMEWAEALRIESQRLEPKGMHVYTEWLRRAFRNDVPFDRIVRELLTSEGGCFEHPPANFFVVEPDPRQAAEQVAQVFMGVRIQCAQCHNHPFERWTMDDYYGFAAFFAQVARKRGEDPREWVVFARGSGEVRNARSGQNAVPKLLGGEEPKIARGADRRVALAEWLTAKDNPWFARNVANRIVARLLGRGIVEPADDVRVSNPPSHPELYELLGGKLVEYGYDVRKLIRDVCGSRTYQAAVPAEGVPASTFAGALVRRLSAEQLIDAISQVTGVPTKYRGLPLGARATEVADGRSGVRFLDLFGRPARTSACTCERRSEPTLGQALHLINGPTIEQKLRAPEGRLRRLERAKASDAVFVEELWLAAYARYPSEAEREAKVAWLGAQKSAREAREDLCWAVLNSKEFLFQH